MNPLPPSTLPLARHPARSTRLRAVPWLVAGGAAWLLSACMHGPLGGHSGHGAGHASHQSGPAARAELQATRGHAASGWVMFHQEAGGVFLHVRVSGLKPNQQHGFHVHEKGDCSSGDGMGTGGHFNPAGKPHGPQHGDHHAGDLPALQADAQGVAEMKVSVPGLTIGSGAADIVGRGLIVHADPDDYKTQPTGNSGARIACAVIQRLR